MGQPWQSLSKRFPTSRYSSLNLDSCQGEITDAGLQCLVSCYQLSSLVISYIDKVGTLWRKLYPYRATRGSWSVLRISSLFSTVVAIVTQVWRFEFVVTEIDIVFLPDNRRGRSSSVRKWDPRAAYGSCVYRTDRQMWVISHDFVVLIIFRLKRHSQGFLHDFEEASAICVDHNTIPFLLGYDLFLLIWWIRIRSQGIKVIPVK